MEIEMTRDGDELLLSLDGRLDTTMAPKLEEKLKGQLEDVKSLIIDFERLLYISSAGLRILLVTQKKMNRQGKMVIRHVNETIMEIFSNTGFADILTIE